MSKTCYHCGDDVIGKGIHYDDKVFCCNGCKSVYQLLSSNELGGFYDLEANAGVKPEGGNEHRFAFLQVDEIAQKFIDFEDEKSIHVTLYLPKIHCSSCIYLLENLHRIEPAVKSCQVNFAKRTAAIVYDKNKLTLAALALMLDKIGYGPNFSSQEEIKKKKNYTYLYKLGVAGFAFGSIMLWTFPEYLGIEDDNPEFRNFTSYLSLIVSIPVLLYSANEYLIAAYKSLRFGSINLDVPISIGILALYTKSAYNIIMGLGPGYMDSFAGFIFFLLIGKWFQSKTYDSLSFERDYKSYFPVAVTKKIDDEEVIVEIDQLKVGDRILIRNEEVIPCDAELISYAAKIDYSFVTGESELISKSRNEFIYAGGKLVGKMAEFEVRKESSRSHLTQLWNDAGRNQETPEESDKLSIYFLIGVLLIAAITAVYYMFTDSAQVTEIVVSVLIVACPCALALSKPFTYGNIMRVLGRKGLYLKNTSIIEKINEVSDIVFDKTGTLTSSANDNVSYHGKELNPELKGQILVLANSSTHPLSRQITLYLNQDITTSKGEDISDFKEVTGKGIEGSFNGRSIRLGSADFVGFPDKRLDKESSSHVVIDGVYWGKFIFESALREGIHDALKQLEKSNTIHVISGDRDKDRALVSDMISAPENIQFEQSPQDKKQYIKDLQTKNRTVLMIGDGLNDAGALDIADVGIAVSEDVFRFTPSSDAILKADNIQDMDRFLNYSAFSKKVLLICYIFSILYNVVGLAFAVTGNLTPLIAAILMPLSSISIVAISTFTVLFKRL